MSPRGFKRGEGPRGPEIKAELAQGRPKVAQDGTKTGQDGPAVVLRGFRDGPRRARKGPRIVPKCFLNGPKKAWEAIGRQLGRPMWTRLPVKGTLEELRCPISVPRWPLDEAKEGNLAKTSRK